jgi:hypothetical protein
MAISLRQTGAQGQYPRNKQCKQKGDAPGRDGLQPQKAPEVLAKKSGNSSQECRKALALFVQIQLILNPNPSFKI